MKPERRCGETRGFIYLCFLFRTGGFCFSKILRLCRNSRHKTRLSYCREKAFAATLCPIAEYAANPFSRVSRRQRYNTLDFAEQNRVPTVMLRAPIGNPAAKGIFPLQFLISLAGAYTNCKSNSLKIKKRCNLRHIIGRKLQRFITLNVNKKWAAISTALI